MIIALPQDISAAGKDFLTSKGYELKLGDGTANPENMAETIKGTDALLLRLGSISEKMLEDAPDLKVIGRHGVGYDNCPVDFCKEHNIPILITPFATTCAVAEHVIMFALASVRELVWKDKTTRAGEWAAFRGTPKSYLLQGKTMGIAGFGRIGRDVARRAHFGLDMDVVCYDPFLTKDKVPDYVKLYDNLYDMLEVSDVVTIHMPMSPAVEGLVNKEFLSHMKPTAHFINTARGKIVNEKDLYDALVNGTIAGAAADVMADEPFKMDNPLLSLDNFTLTPHVSTINTESLDMMGLHAAMGIHDVLSGNFPNTAKDVLYLNVGGAAGRK